jgi:hypothetical protein
MEDVMSDMLRWVTDPATKWKETVNRYRLLRELDSAGPDSDRVAHSLGLSTGELRRLVADGATDLPVNDLLTQLGLDPAEIEHVDPAMMQDLIRVCALCTDHDQCRADLAAGTATRHWKEYCLNQSSIEALKEEVSSHPTR